jgi:lambda family phage portal protein
MARSVYKQERAVRAIYDNAKTTAENANLWKDVDALSSASANSPSVRKTLRERARYETSNNTYAKGLIEIIANDTVGKDINIQLGNSTLAAQVERDFRSWARKVHLSRKLRCMRAAKARDGEAFASLVTNPAVDHPIKLDVQPFECDRVESWFTNVFKDNEIDGIRFDEYGNPIAYRVLNHHPGDYRAYKKGGAAGEWIDRKYILHYFTTVRPGQVRGIPEITPALNLFGQLRKFTAAVLESASRAAEISAVIQTTLCPDNVSAELADPVTVIEAERNAIVSIPEGWTLNQLKPEQPAATYPDFKNEIINEIARTMNVPYCVAAGNSSGYNYASGRLDFQSYDRTIDVERRDLEADVILRVYEEWLKEYAYRKSLSPEEIEAVERPIVLYGKRGHVDPKKEADSDDTRLDNDTLTLSLYWAQQGEDWRDMLTQRITERIECELEWNRQRKSAGLDPAPYPGKAERKTTDENPDPDE